MKKTIKIDVTKVMEAKDQKERDVAIEEVLYGMMQILGHSFSYSNFIQERLEYTINYFNMMKKEVIKK